MKINVIRSEKNVAEFTLEGERHTLPNLLRNKLLGNKSVEFVSYVLDHPMDTGARFIIRTSSKPPKKILEEAAKDVEADIDDFGKKLKKALK